MQDGDPKTLDEALSSFDDCETLIDWISRVDTTLCRANSGSYGHNGELDVNLELPGLTDPSVFILEKSLPSQQLQVSPNEPSSLRFTENTFSRSGTPFSLAKVQCKKKKQQRKYSNRARDAQREELVFLRQKVRDLKLQLDQRRSHQKPQTASAPFSSVAAPPSAVTLQNRRERSKLAAVCIAKLSTKTPSANFSSIAAPVVSTASPAHLVTVWSEMAQRQALERLKTERENVRLKLVFEKQTKIARRLERIVKKCQI